MMAIAALAVVGVILGGIMVWQIQARQSLSAHTLAREVQREEDRLRVAIVSEMRQSLRAHENDLFSRVSTSSLNSLMTADPRFPGRTPGAAGTPGFFISSLSKTPAPAVFNPFVQFISKDTASPIERLRHVSHTSTFDYTFTRRYNPAEAATLLTAKSGQTRITTREVPVTSFALVCLEDLAFDQGFTFTGPALVMGQSIASPIFSYRISPFQIPDAQIAINERVLEFPAIFAGFGVTPSDLLSPQSPTPQQQSIAKKGTLFLFDGHTVSSTSGSTVPGVYTGYFMGAKRVIIDLSLLPKNNTVIDASANAADPANQISAYHIQCTNALAQDRGIVVYGTTNPRICDIVSTNGAVTLAGAHSGGPLMIGTSLGGVYFSNTGDAFWNAVVIAPVASPYITASSASPLPSGARSINLGAGLEHFNSVELSLDTIGFDITGDHSAGWTIGLGPTTVGAGMPNDIAWVEASGSNLRFAVATPSGVQYSGFTALTSSPVRVIYSRTQRTFRSIQGGAIFEWSMPSDRPRVEMDRVRWTGSITRLDIVPSAGGATIGAAVAGNITFRGLVVNGAVSRFGPATYQVTSQDSGADPLEPVAPRLVILSP